MKHICKIEKDGDIIIPDEAIEALGLKVGDIMNIEATDGSIILTKRRDNMFTKLDCWVRGMWLNITMFLKSGNGTPVDGCVYTNHEVHRNCVVTVGYCEHCDKIDISWQKEGSVTDADLMKYYGTTDSDKEKL